MMRAIGNGQPLTNRQEQCLLEGKAMSHQDYYLFGAGEIKRFVFNPVPYTGKTIESNPVVFSATSGVVLIDFYRGVTETGDGTPLFTYNRKAGSDVPKSELSVNPTTISDTGTRFAGSIVPSTGLNPSTSTGGSNNTTQEVPIVLDHTVKYLVDVENKNGAGTYIFIIFAWFER